MIIKQLTLSGFKSFGRKTVFGFERGVTAVVGPNGSGKSNVADAIRWVLGEQSPKTLRVKKTEDLIFAGTGKKARGSVAEVRLLFDNSDGAAPLDFSEIEISRKLYGSGESDYRLNGRTVRLQEIQQLLAQARIGINSYAIIGQGTIDSLIMANPTERKLLFEEASGIRSFELQRTQALKRLRATEANMQRARDVLGELTPRLANLERVRQAAAQRGELAAELAELRQQQIQAERRRLELELSDATTTATKLEVQMGLVSDRLNELIAEQSAAIKAQAEAERGHKAATKELHQLEAAREQLLNDASVCQAELQQLRERLQEAVDLEARESELALAIDQIKKRQRELTHELASAQNAQDDCIQERESITATVRSVQQRLVKQRNQLQDTSHHQYITHAHTIVNDLHRSLEQETIDPEQLRSMTYRVRRLLALATGEGQTDGLEQLKLLQTALTEAIKVREAVDERYTQTTLELRRIELEQIAITKELEDAQDHRKELVRQRKQVERWKQHEVERERQLGLLQEKVDANYRDTNQQRARLGETAQPQLDQAVRIARELEQQRAAHHQVTEQSQRVNQQIRTLEKERAALPKPAKPVAASSLAPQELKDAIIRVEARVAALTELGEDRDNEFTEVSERHESLTAQLADLEAAQENLQAIIDKLDGTIRTQFESGFQEISSGFDASFQQLFGGGSAKLTLKKGEGDELGIDIEVTPPGKRVKHLSALSGGERSLAGIALLAAILRAHPSPFVVLDEVDAALDEANADRFRDLLKRLAKRSQIITITHNRSTMMAARALYGVTMDSDHVSRMVSVQLEEAASLSEATA